MKIQVIILKSLTTHIMFLLVFFVLGMGFHFMLLSAGIVGWVNLLTSYVAALLLLVGFSAALATSLRKHIAEKGV